MGNPLASGPQKLLFLEKFVGNVAKKYPFPTLQWENCFQDLACLAFPRFDLWGVAETGAVLRVDCVGETGAVLRVDGVATTRRQFCEWTARAKRGTARQNRPIIRTAKLFWPSPSILEFDADSKSVN